ncbi:Antigen [Armadillidium nasatum]|uniref:Antigen n=1 Tax=Armadillidium nasatum TaxID=96803 RepID=A0A5N5STF0_9CRUS|nr:Antigen [Armadillidium nasatum]
MQHVVPPLLILNTLKCPKSMYQCRISKNCIHLAWICDGVQDCLDGSDEGNFCKYRKNKNKKQKFY